MKKVYTIKNGKTIFIIAFLSLLLLAVISTVWGILSLPAIEGIILLLSDLLYLIILFVFIRLHYLNYIKITSQCVSHKNETYLWDEVCLTLDYTTPNFTRNAYTYRIYFSENFYNTREEIKNANKKGFCIDLDNKRLSLLLQHYFKKIHILRESPRQNKILNMIIDHNNNINQSIEQIQDNV